MIVRLRRVHELTEGREISFWMGVTVSLLLLLVTSPLARAQTDENISAELRPAQQRLKGEAGQGELLLIRNWDPKSGQLVGWMPTHGVEINLEQLGGPPAKFESNEGVTVVFPRRPRAPIVNGEVRVAPEAVTFQGRRWLPIERELNIVKVRDFLFYVKSIVFSPRGAR